MHDAMLENKYASAVGLVAEIPTIVTMKPPRPPESKRAMSPPPPRAMSPLPRAMSQVTRPMSPPRAFSPPTSRQTSPLRQNSEQCATPKRNSPAWFHPIKPNSPPSVKKPTGIKSTAIIIPTVKSVQTIKPTLTPNEEVMSLLDSLDDLKSSLPMPKSRERPSSPPPTPPQQSLRKSPIQRPVSPTKEEMLCSKPILRKKCGVSEKDTQIARPVSQPVFPMSRSGSPDPPSDRPKSPNQRPYSLQPRSSTPTNFMRPISPPPKRGASTHDEIRIRSDSSGLIRPEPRKHSMPLFSHPTIDQSQNRLSMGYREFEEKPRQRPSNVPPQLLKVKSPRAKFEPKFEVPLWSVDDVVAWVNRAGFQEYAPAFLECGVDGDMLLQLTDDEVKDDIGISNGILRKRFIRELKDLKKNADYTSCDGGMTANFLNKISSEFRVYAYNLILKELSLDFMQRLNATDLEDMLKDSGVESSIHRHKIIEAVLSLDDDSSDSLYSEPMYDVYLSYPKCGGAELASLITIQLERRKLTVFSDSHDGVGVTDSVLSQIKDSRYYVLVMPPGALDSCLEDTTGSDRLHTEIAAALAADIKIIPVSTDFQWPSPDELPEDIRAVAYFNGVRWVHDYQDACIDKLEKLIRGETFLKAESPYSYSRSGTGRSRGDSGRSTPSISSPLTIQKLLRNRTVSIDSAIGSHCT